ncbi:hypothetical protein CDEST_00092 [Colletotrichum destructivum]|uniref:RING-type domain-containing protein n=1 Tax=Colletotrichum destructivum TaxID=34406 RepID=A0AAX4HVC7_9PEZI|nr:hypothetical protein CDEST_00092 [Colletotrichum destructivum]
MCYIIMRFYKCWANKATTEHRYSYLNRCANPRYAACVAPGALGILKETYDVPCPSCTYGFFQTRAQPKKTEWSSGSAEDSPMSRAAAREYAKSLIEFLIMAFTSADGIPAPGQDQRAFRVCKMEMACRFDKDHFENGPNCEAIHCEEQKDLFGDIKTNTWTEMHNISAAMRRAVSRGYLFPYRGYWPCRGPLYDPHLMAHGVGYVVPVTDMNTERPQNEGPSDTSQESYESCVRRHLAQPAIPSMTTAPRNPKDAQPKPTPVIPFLRPDWNDQAGFESIWRNVFRNQIVALQGEAIWKEIFLQCAQLQEPNKTFNRHDADEALSLRKDLCQLAARLISVDSGLPPARAIAVAAVMTPLLDPNPSPIATIDVEITGLLQKLFQARKASEQERYRFAGDMIAFDDSWRYTKYHLKRNREITLNDEHTREVAIENASIPLTEPEIDRLRAAGSYDIDCVVCDEEMGDPQDSHAAVRLKCDAHHSIGKNCWMRFNRRKKGQYTNGIRCHSCADKIIGTWDVPINLELLDAYDIGTSTPLGLTLPGDLLE